MVVSGIDASYQQYEAKRVYGSLIFIVLDMKPALCVSCKHISVYLRSETCPAETLRLQHHHRAYCKRMDGDEFQAKWYGNAW